MNKTLTTMLKRWGEYKKLPPTVTASDGSKWTSTITAHTFEGFLTWWYEKEKESGVLDEEN